MQIILRNVPKFISGSRASLPKKWRYS